MSGFFIERPIFSTVISIVIVLMGGAAALTLPIEQYPNVVPPSVVVTASYPGADSEVVAESVAAPLEEEINGVDDMLYMESTSTNTGSLQITVTFALGTDPDQNAINVNNRVQAALPRLPQIVRDLGVRAESQATSILLAAVLYSPDESLSTLEISNYALLNVIDELLRLPGVGEASLFGAQNYSMRIWLRPDQMAEYDVTAADVAAAIREQNGQFAAGRLGAEPAPKGQAFTYNVATRGQLASAEEFENIILRARETGGALRLGDVAGVELGSQQYGFAAIYDGQPAVPIRVTLQPGANALDTANDVAGTLERLSARFPAGLEFTIPFDTTEFIEIAVREVVVTLLVAVALVVIVTFIFLQHLRATLIPITAIPVSLIGTFAGMQAFGFSINLLTLFGLILAIGIVVDNAIIVMENVERLMHEQNLEASEAAVRTMQQVSGAVVASTLVLVAVFAPVAFLEGLSGELYRQFAVTISVSIVISAVVALTLTPALCALLLDREPREPMLPFRIFNRGFEAVTAGFVAGVGFLLRRRVLGVLLAAGIAGATVLLLQRMPSGLVPQEDQGVALVTFNLPPAASLQRSAAVRDELDRRIGEFDEVQQFISFAGQDIVTGTLRTNAGAGFANLTHWDERPAPEQHALSVVRRVIGTGARMPEANVIAFVPPPILGLSLTGGIEGYVQVIGEAAFEEIDAMGRQLVETANARPEITNARTTLDTSFPRYFAELDREKARAMDVPVDRVFAALQATFGSLYVNDFIMSGRNWQVNLQSEGEFRDQPEDLRRVHVRSAEGELAPVSSLVSLRRESGPDTINRFDVYSANNFLADPAPGYTTGQAKAAAEAAMAEVFGNRNDVVLGWIGEAYQIDVASGTAGAAFGLGLLMVFLILAAQYERWNLPLAVATAVPFAVLGAAAAAVLRGFPNDIYFQVGLLVLIGLAAKNAILLVEFAHQHRQAGMRAGEAARTAARQRFRAIMMTALTFIIGALPLMFATGAGAASRREIGTIVVSGMIGASTLALLFVPLFYTLLENLSGRLGRDDTMIAK